MPKRYFTKQVFTERPDMTIEMDVSDGWLPLTPKKAEELLIKLRAIAQQYGKDVAITIWVEHEDGSKEELIFG